MLFFPSSERTCYPERQFNKSFFFFLKKLDVSIFEGQRPFFSPANLQFWFWKGWRKESNIQITNIQLQFVKEQKKLAILYYSRYYNKASQGIIAKTSAWWCCWFEYLPSWTAQICSAMLTETLENYFLLRDKGTASSGVYFIECARPYPGPPKYLLHRPGWLLYDQESGWWFIAALATSQHIKDGVLLCSGNLQCKMGRAQARTSVQFCYLPTLKHQQRH